MSFANPMLAWGALAFSIPLILHVMNRSRFKRVEWGAMHLLESVVKVNHKRFRLEQWILLLVRCAIPVLLALCLARPVLTGARMLTGDAPVSLVVLLDTSYSMDATRDGVSHFDEAIDAACSIVDATSRGSQIAVIQTGGGPLPVFDQPVFDSAAVVRRLNTLQAGYGASDMQQALDVGLATLAGMSHGRRELIVISDFQPADWKTDGNVGTAIRQQVDAMAIKPELTLMQVGGEVKGNVSIESLDFSNRPLGVGQQLAVRANLRNHSDQAHDNARVILKVDGKERTVSQLALPPNASTQTLFPCNFETSGSHVIEVEVTVDDSLATDNNFAAAVTIWNQIDVLLVDGDPHSEPLKSETDFLAVALTPFSSGRLKLSDLVKTKTVNHSKFKPEMLDGCRVLVLANIAKLERADDLEAVRNFVRGGGALLVAAGNRIDSKWYNQHLFAKGGGLLPAEFGLPRGKIDENGQSSHIVAQHFDHPAMQFFNEAANGDLSTGEIRQWYQLKPRTEVAQNDSLDDEIGQRASPVVVVRLDNGDPLLVEQQFGDGVVMQLATSCDADWSDLPLRPFFVPMMQQLVTTMATRLTPPRNIRTGEPVVALFDAPVTTPQKDNAKTTAAQEIPALSLSLITPEGSRRTLQAIPAGNRLMARFDGTRRPGLYTMTTPEGDAETIHFVASTSRDESDLSTLDEPKLQSLAEGMAASVVGTPAEYLEQDRLRRHGREIWKYVLMALLAFLFLELVLQQRFSRVRT